MKPFVFLGPSLPVTEARKILDAAYLPPVSMGDIYRLMARKPTVIAIIDGLFEQTPAVWHKEILFALHAGVRVLGASSMGALRAAELAAFGMEGVGDVFDAFHRGELEDDDEVAVTHAAASEGFRSLSDAMVNLRRGIRDARDAGAIGAGTHDRLIAVAKGLYYPERSWPRVFEVAATDPDIPGGELDALRARIARARPDVKRADAIRLLQHLARAPEGAATGTNAADASARLPGAPAPSFDFEPTYFWEQLILHEASSAAHVDDGTTGAETGAVSLAALRRHVRLHPARGREALSTALLLYLADEQAGRRGLTLDGTPDAAGPADADLDPHDRQTLARGQVAIDALVRAAPDPVHRRLPAALAHLGRLRPVLDEIARKQDILRGLGVRAVTPADAGVGLDALLAWYQARFGAFVDSPEAHAERTGFTSVEEFIAEVALEYLAEHPAR